MNSDFSVTTNQHLNCEMLNALAAGSWNRRILELKHFRAEKQNIRVQNN